MNMTNTPGSVAGHESFAEKNAGPSTPRLYKLIVRALEDLKTSILEQVLAAIHPLLPARTSIVGHKRPVLVEDEGSDEYNTLSIHADTYPF